MVALTREIKREEAALQGRAEEIYLLEKEVMSGMQKMEARRRAVVKLAEREEKRRRRAEREARRVQEEARRAQEEARRAREEARRVQEEEERKEAERLRAERVKLEKQKMKDDLQIQEALLNVYESYNEEETEEEEAGGETWADVVGMGWLRNWMKEDGWTF